MLDETLGHSRRDALRTLGAFSAGAVATALVDAAPAGADSSPYEEKAFLPANVKDFGAVGDGTTNDTTAVNNAIASLPTRGGTVFFPRGAYSLSGQINVDTKQSIRLVGESGVSSGLGTGSALVYTGTASPFISAQDLTGFELRDLSVFYSNASFTGTLVDLSGSAHCAIERCMLAGSSVRSAAQLVLLNQALSSQILNCVLLGAAIGIRGSSGGTGDFSNAITVTGCSFPEGAMTNAAIAGAGQGWMISGCTFEPLYSTSAPGGYKQIAGSAIGICFAGCWFGDNTATGYWVDFSGAGGVGGASFVGNCFNGLGAGTGIRLGDSAAGVSITGNQFAGLVNGVRIDNSARQVMIAGNNYDVSGARILNSPLNGIVEEPGTSSNGALGLYGPVSYGGNALLAPTALSHPSRVLNTVYQASTTRAAMVIATVRILNTAGQSAQITALVENANPPTLEQAHFSSNDPSDLQTTITFMVPAGWRYKLGGIGTGTMVLNVLTEVLL
jgi:Pectate lyase superfamily protein